MELREVQVGDQLRMRGCLELALANSQGRVLEYRKTENTIVTVGRSWVLRAIQSGNAASSEVIGYLAVGTATTAPDTGDTALANENTRVAVGPWDNAGSTANPPYWSAYVQFATDEANTTLGEVGLFNSSAGGIMLGRATYNTIDKTTSNTLGITYTVSN